jgi:hypothetical protein
MISIMSNLSQSEKIAKYGLAMIRSCILTFFSEHTKPDLLQINCLFSLNLGLSNGKWKNMIVHFNVRWRNVCVSFELFINKITYHKHSSYAKMWKPPSLIYKQIGHEEVLIHTQRLSIHHSTPRIQWSRNIHMTFHKWAYRIHYIPTMKMETLIPH